MEIKVKDGGTLSILVTKNTNGTLSGEAIATAPEGASYKSKTVTFEMNDRSNGFVMKTIDEVRSQEIKLTDIDGITLKPKPDITIVPSTPPGAPKETTHISELETKLASLEKQYKTLRESGQD